MPRLAATSAARRCVGADVAVAVAVAAATKSNPPHEKDSWAVVTLASCGSSRSHLHIAVVAGHTCLCPLPPFPCPALPRAPTATAGAGGSSGRPGERGHRPYDWHRSPAGSTWRPAECRLGQAERGCVGHARPSRTGGLGVRAVGASGILGGSQGLGFLGT